MSSLLSGRRIALIGALIVIIALARRAEAINTTANRVLGQIDFVHNDYKPTLNASAMLLPSAIAIDTSMMPNRLYVADSLNNRVLGYSDISKLANGKQADLVIGQPNFTSSIPNNGGVSAGSLAFPSGLAVDKGGRLYVVDTANNRVLEYNSPFTLGTKANRVFGQQGKFTSNLCNKGGINARSLCIGQRFDGIAISPGGELFVADTHNNRVLEYDHPLSSDAASAVFGQKGSFVTNAANNGGAASAEGLSGPSGITLDTAGDLYVGDFVNNRVLEYDAPFLDTAADLVFGQNGSFTANSCPATSTGSTCSPRGIAIDNSGNLYVATNSRVLVFEAPFGTITLASAVLGQPAGNFTQDTCNNMGSGLATANGLCTPSGMTADGAEDIYIADTHNNRVLFYKQPLTNGTTADLVLGQLDFTSRNQADARSLNGPAAVAVDKSVLPNRVYVVDQGNNRVLGYSSVQFANGASANLVIGQPNFVSTGTSNLREPSAAAVDPAGNLYVADTANSRVVEYDTPFAHGGKPRLIFPTRSPCSDRHVTTCGPLGVAVDEVGRLFISDTGNDRVVEYNTPLLSQTPDHVFEGSGYGYGVCPLCAPRGIGLDPFGNLYVAGGAYFDGFSSLSLNWVTSIFDPLVVGGGARATFGRILAKCFGASTNLMCQPNDAASDLKSNLYVADTGNNRILEYNSPLPTGASGIGASSVFGQNGSFTNNNCAAGADGLCGAKGVAADGPGNVYIADTANNRILEYDQVHPAGAIVSPPSFNFGACVGGSSIVPNLAILANFQAVPLKISRIGLTGNFTQVNYCGSGLAPFGSCSFQLLFVPKRIGPDNGVLTITDDASGGSQSIKLTGIGDSALANSTSHLAFGNQLVGTKSVPQAVTLTNTRDSRSNNLQISLTGDFVQTNTCGSSLPANGNCVISIRFVPAATGPRPGILEIDYMDCGSPIQVTLSGVGVLSTPTPTATPRPTLTPSKGASPTPTPKAAHS